MSDETFSEKLTSVGEYIGEEIVPRIYSGTSSLLAYASSFIWSPTFDPAIAKASIQTALIRVKNRKINLQPVVDQKIRDLELVFIKQGSRISDCVCFFFFFFFFKNY